MRKEGNQEDMQNATEGREGRGEGGGWDREGGKTERGDEGRLKQGRRAD